MNESKSAGGANANLVGSVGRKQHDWREVMADDDVSMTMSSQDMQQIHWKKSVKLQDLFPHQVIYPTVTVTAVPGQNRHNTHMHRSTTRCIVGHRVLCGFSVTVS